MSLGAQGSTPSRTMVMPDTAKVLSAFLEPGQGAEVPIEGLDAPSTSGGICFFQKVCKCVHVYV